MSRPSPGTSIARCRAWPRAGVEDVQLAVQLVDDLAVRVGARPADVPLRAPGELGGGAARHVQGVEVERAGAVRVEIDLVADPHRIALGARGPGDLADLAAREVEDPEVLSPASLIALPGAEVAGEGGVDHLLAVRREVGAAALRHRQRLGETAGHRHRVDPAAGVLPAVAQRAEDDRLAVRRPPVDLVVVPPPWGQGAAGRVEGELLRHAAGRRHHVDLLVAVVLPGEGDPLAVRRELGEQLEPRMRRDPARRPPLGRRRPQIAGVGEHDLVLVDVREAEQLGLGGRCAGGQAGEAGGGEAEQDSDGARHGSPPGKLRTERVAGDGYGWEGGRVARGLVA